MPPPPFTRGQLGSSLIVRFSRTPHCTLHHKPNTASHNLAQHGRRRRPRFHHQYCNILYGKGSAGAGRVRQQRAMIQLTRN